MADTFKIKLTPDAILKQQFATVRKGYDSTEVDNYLDQIIADYENFYDAIDALTIENKKLKQELSSLEERIADTPKVYQPTRPETVTPKTTDYGASAPSTNFEIIQRLSKLERQVYQLEQKLDNQN